MQQQGSLAGRRRALERSPADADDCPAPRELRQHLRQKLGTFNGVELVSRLGEPRRGVQVVVGAERHDQDVSLAETGVSGHAARLGIDRGDRLLQESHPRFDDVAVRETDRVERRPSEHHVELRVTEDERIALVDQSDVDVVAERVRQCRRQFETPEAGSQDDDPLHRAMLVDLQLLKASAVGLDRFVRRRPTASRGIFRKTGPALPLPPE